MAKATKFLSITMVVSLFLIVAVAEGRSTLGIDGFQNAKSSTLACVSVVSVKKHDTCDAIIQTFQLNPETFAQSNPNPHLCGSMAWYLMTDGTSFRTSIVKEFA